jgi:SIR2-like domain
MQTEIDPSSQLRTLTQALSHRDSRLGFLLGAGCGCSVRDSGGGPLIPAVDALTKNVRDALSKSDAAPDLTALEKQYSDDSEPCPNIEKLLSRVRALREIAGKGKVRGLSAAGLDTLDERICRAIETIVDKDLPSGRTSYASFARWIREIDRHQPVEIFTTNYDLLLEEALERCQAPFFDGFIGAHQPFFDVSAMELDRLPDRWTRVWKVHGSINWRQDAGGGIVRSRDGTSKPLIFPSHLKYAESRRLPYLAMRDRLRNFIRDRGIMVTCGYSFADEHINEDILSGLAANAGSVCYALMFTSIASFSPLIKLALARPNLNVLGTDGGVLRGHEVTWPPGAAVDLGDFEQFGRFLEEEVMGEAHAPSL